MWWLLAMPITMAAQGLVVQSSTPCPSTTQVTVQLRPLLPAGTALIEAHGDETFAGTERAQVTLENGARVVRLFGRDGRSRNERALPAAAGCEELARAAAVLVAAWQFQGRVNAPPLPEATTSAPTSPRPAAPVVVADPRAHPEAPPPAPPAPSPIPPDATMPPSEAPGPAPVATVQSTASPTPTSPPQRRLGLGAGVAVARTAAQFPFSVTAEALYEPDTGAGLRLHLARSSRTSLAVGVGHASWARTDLGLGVSLTERRGPWAGQAHAELVGALFSISGEDFAANEDSSQLAGGGTLGGRMSHALAGGAVWLDLGLTTWAGRHQVALRDGTATADLATFEVELGLGLDFFVWP